MTRTELYRHYLADGRLLYVGISLNTVVRLTQHRVCSPWFDQIDKITIERFDDRAAALAAERLAIEQEKPLYNAPGRYSVGKRPNKTLSAKEVVDLIGIEREPHYTGTNDYAPRYSRDKVEAFIAGRSA